MKLVYRYNVEYADKDKHIFELINGKIERMKCII